jgi:hypothetical protein
MNDSQSKTLQIRVETLPVVYAALIKGLSEAELGGAALHEVISQHVSAACVLCGILINGDDLNTIALAHGADELSDPRLNRLKQGYCCRRSCDSYYYKLVFAPHPVVNWQKIIEKLSTPRAQTSTPEVRENAAPSEKDIARRTLRLKIAAGAGLVLLLLLVKHILSGGSLPGLHRAPKYMVDPKSLPTVPGR